MRTRAHFGSASVFSPRCSNALSPDLPCIHPCDCYIIRHRVIVPSDKAGCAFQNRCGVPATQAGRGWAMQFTRAAVLLSILMQAAPLGAQTFGEIRGTVTDPSGAIVTGAIVTI